MRSAVASGRSAAVASSSSAPTAEPLPMRPSSLLLTSRPRTTTTIVAPASAPISGPARGHCAGASRLRRSKQQRTSTTPAPSGLFLPRAAADGALPPLPSPSSSSLSAFLQAFWKFLRPHTIRGTVLGSLAITARSLLEQGAPLASLDWAGLAPRAALGVLALLAGNGFIVGINQIYDVDIDVVNKPFLPVAAGELSPKAAWVLVVGLAIAGIALSWGVFGKEIGILYAFGLTLGAVYSVPPFRLKTKPVPAFLIIATVRGFLLNYGVYSAVRAALGLQFIWSPAMAFITAFVTTFAVAIAVTKDLADVEGDRAFGVSTFATRLGVENVATLGTGLLLANYAGAIGMALAAPDAFFRPTFAAAAHAFLAAALLASSKALSNAKYSKGAVADFYRRIWSLFYAEYALFAFL